MPTITPVSDLRNYPNVLDKVSAGSPVYLTKNGHGAYCIRDMQDEEEFIKAQSMIRLLCELNAGIRSAEDSNWLDEEEIIQHFDHKRNTMRNAAGAHSRSGMVSDGDMQSDASVLSEADVNYGNGQGSREDGSDL